MATRPPGGYFSERPPDSYFLGKITYMMKVIFVNPVVLFKAEKHFRAVGKRAKLGVSNGHPCFEIPSL